MSVFIAHHNKGKIEAAIGRNLRDDEEGSVESIDHFTASDWAEIVAIHRVSRMTAACYMMHKLKTGDLVSVKECCEGALREGKSWDEWRRTRVGS